MSGASKATRRAGWGLGAVVATAGIATALLTAPASAGGSTLSVTVTHDGSSTDAGIDCTDGSELDCTLRAAIESATDDATIELGSGTYELDDQVVIERPVTIRGNGRGKTTIVATGDHRHLRIDPSTNGSVTIRDLTLRNGGGTDQASQGAAIQMLGGKLHIESVRFADNAVNGLPGALGGALAVQDSAGDVSISNSSFENNGSIGGGALFVADVSSDVTITHTTFAGNEAAGEGRAGGAILLYETTGRIDVTESSFVGNSAGGLGGALSIQAADDVRVTRSVFEGNSSELGGGALHVASGSSVVVENTTLLDNSGPASVATSRDSTTTLRFVTIEAHTAAFATNGGTLAVTDSALVGVRGCSAIDVRSGSIADGASDADCGETSAPDLDLVRGIQSPFAFPLPTSPLVGSASSDCPPTDQRGTSRGSDCTAGAIEVLGILCPPEPLPREEDIECGLDVAVAGSSTHVLAQMNPVMFDGNVSISRGGGDFTFRITADAPGDAIDIAVAGGLYTTTLAVMPAGPDGSGPGNGDSDSDNGDSNSEGDDGSGGDGSDGSDNSGDDGGSTSDDEGSSGGGGGDDGGAGGSDTNGGGPVDGAPAAAGSNGPGGQATELAFTGVSTPAATATGLAMLLAGINLVRGAGRGPGRAPGAR
jgi:hypothetical protein